MRALNRRGLCRLTGVLSILVIGVTAGCGRAAVREVTLIARGMTFAAAEGPGGGNPVLRFRAGERVRLVLKNEAAGLIHDVAIPAWNVAVDPIPAGQSAETTFTVPAAAGPAEYRCRPHAEMMRGVIEVATGAS